MVRIRIPLTLLAAGIGAALPTYSEVRGSYQPVTPGKVTADGIAPGVALSDPILGQVTVLVDVPDEDCTNGQPDPVKIKARYPTHPLVTSGRFG